MRTLHHLVRLVVIALVGTMLATGLAAAPAAATGGTSGGEPASPGISSLAEADSVIEGAVYDEAGRPLDNILVEAFAVGDPGGDPLASDLTYEHGDIASHGAYRLRVPAGDYLVRFSSPSWAERHVYETYFHGGGTGETVTASAAAPVLLPDVTLYPDTGAPVSGVVRLPDGAAAAGVEVSLVRVHAGGYGSWVDHAVTDAAGRYTFPAVNRGRAYTVQARGGWTYDGEPLGYPDVFLGGAPVAGLAESFTLPSGSTGTELAPIDLVAGAELHGVVRGPDGQVPDDLDVYLYVVTPGGLEYVTSRYFSDAEGAFSLPALPGYDYTVATDVYARWSDGQTYLGDTLDESRARVVSVGAGSVDVGAITVGVNSAVLSVTVLDADGDPVDDGAVAVRALRRTETGGFVHVRYLSEEGDGVFARRVPQGATYTVEVHDHATGSTVYLGGAATEAEARTVTIGDDDQVVDAGSVTVGSRPVKLRGAVLDADGLPLAGARVVLRGVYAGCDRCDDWVRSTTTNAEGRYALPVRPWYAEEYGHLVVEASLDELGYQPAYVGGPDRASATAIPVPTATTELDPVRLTLGQALLLGELTNADGTPVAADSYVSLFRWQGDDQYGYFEYHDDVAVSGSRYAFRDVSPGSYVVTVRSYAEDGELRRGGTAGALVPRSRTAAGVVEVVDGVSPTTVPTVELVRTAALRGEVTTEDGQGLGGGFVSLTLYGWVPDGSGGGTFQEVDYDYTSSGAFAFTGITPGSYAVRARYFGPDGYSDRYRTSWSGGRRPTSPGSPGVVTVEGADVALDVQLRLPRGVTGTVLDEAGLPVEGAQVELLAEYDASCECHSWLDQTTTRADGTYTFPFEGYYEHYVDFTVSAQATDAGYPVTYLGDVTDPAAATLLPTLEDGDAVGTITLARAPRVVRGRIATEDGEPVDGSSSVSLYRWDEASQSFSFDTSTWTDGRRFAFTEVPAGTYTVSVDYSSNRAHPYQRSWLGGAKAASPDDAGAFTVGESSDLTQLPDVVLDRGIGVLGTVTSTGGTAISGVHVSGWWSTADDWGNASATTDDRGGYQLRVPAGATLSTVYAYRTSFEDVSLGDWETPAAQVGDQDVVLDLEMTPRWGAVGRVAGEQRDYCLARTSYRVAFAGLDLEMGSGRLHRTDRRSWAEAFEPDNVDGVLAPLPGDYSSYPHTWGVSPDGSTLCLQWGTDPYGAVYQALLTERAGGGFDVVYNYDTVPSTTTSKAGHTDGYGRHGTTTVFPGGADNGYADESPTALVKGSLGSEQPGRYAFFFDGFADRGEEPEAGEWPWISGKPSVGQTLTANGGTWLVDGVVDPDVELDYRWFRGTRTLGTGSTYVVQPDDFEKRVRLEVTAFVPGRHLGRAATRVLIRGGAPAATLATAPSLAPESPGVGQTITLDPGAWSPGEGLTDADLTYAYQWFRDGRRVDGSTTEYVTTDADELAEITARVVVSAPDRGTVKARTAAVRVGAMPTLAPVTAPALTGEPKVGSPLTVDPGTWSSEDVSFTYTWYVGWRQKPADAGTDGSVYTPASIDRQDYVTVAVTASAPGFRDGSWATTVGPVMAADAQLSRLTVHLRDEATKAPVANAFVRVCEADSWTCLPSGYTDAQGDLTGSAIAGVTYDVVAYPDAPYKQASARVTTAVTGATETVVELVKPTPPPSNVSIPTSNGTSDGTTPSVHWDQPQDFRVTGCAGVVQPEYTVTFSDGTPARKAALTQGPAVDGLATYSAQIAKFYPSRGDTVISTNVPATCEPGTEPTVVNIYIDPSGVVTDQYGRPIVGATVTLMRSDAAGGPFTVVPNGSDIMSEDNRTNPDTTDSTGFFRWDVVEGFYRVKVQATGCDTFTTNPMEVPPPRVDLMIRLSCTAAAPTATPAISGTAAVGETLTAGPAEWGVLSQVGNQWLRDGQPILGAVGTTYTLTDADAGRDIAVRQTAQRPTYVQEEGRGAPVVFQAVTADSRAVRVALGSAPAAEKPVVSGSGKVGTVLTVADPVWSRAGTVTTRQWRVDGVAVDGATGSSFEVRPGDEGKPVTVVFRGARAGYADGSVTTDAVTTRLGDPARATTAPTISGRPAVGSTLTALPGTWDAAGLELTYRWLRGGVEIAGADQATYQPSMADIGTVLTVEVRAVRAGYAAATASSAGVTVAKLLSTTAAKVSATKVKPGKKVTFSGAVKAAGVESPTGTVTVLDGAKVLKVITLSGTGKGAFKLVLPKLKAGKHKLVARYDGSPTVAGSVSKPVSLTVVKAARPVMTGFARVAW